MPDSSDQPFPCPLWCNQAECAVHNDQAVVHRETPEPPLAPARDPEQMLFLALEQHDDPHGIQPGEPFGVVSVPGGLTALEPDELGWLSEQAAALRMRVLAARGEPVVPIPRRPGRRSGRTPR